MTDTRRSRSERDGHIAKVIPLRRSTRSVDQPASDLSGLVQRAGTTFTELVAMAEDYGLDVPERIQLAAVLLDVRLTAAATTPPQGPESASSPETFERTQDGLQWADDLDSAVGALIELWRCNLDRREFLGAMGALAVTSDVALRWLVAPLDEGVERHVGSRRVGLTDVDEIRVMRRNLKAIDDARGGGAALPTAVKYLRREVAPLLRGRFTDPIGRALFSATADFTLGVGWMAYDAGRHGLAQRYMTQALRMSHAANDRAFGGRVLAAMSHQALHLGDVRHGIDLASAARTGTEGAVTPTVCAMLAAMEACAHASHGDARRCLKALSDAERALGQSNPAEDPAWVDFDEGGLAGHFARSFRDLNRPGEAERFATRSIAICHPRHLRTRMQRYAILATAHVQQGDLEGACAVGRRVLEEARGLSSTRTLDDVTHLVRLVNASGAGLPAREFTEQARALLRPGRRPPATRS
jgi:hypothetical protein